MRKYDLIAISLLMFSTIIVIALCVDPKQFSIKDWQPLMAAFVALGAAGVAYQGATLAYNAAMRKVDLDRSIHEREVRRRQRGTYLRTALAAHIMHHEADHCCQSLQVPQAKDMMPAVFDPKIVNVKTDPAIDEAWQNLDAFSRLVADDLSRLKVQLYNYDTATKRLGGLPFEIPHGHLYTEAQRELCNAVTEIKKLCLRIRDTLRNEEIVAPRT